MRSLHVLDDTLATAAEHVVSQGSGGGIKDGFGQLGVGAMLGRDGVVELTVFNSLEFNTKRPASVVVPCGHLWSSSYFAFYADEEIKEASAQQGDNKRVYLKTQLLPIFELDPVTKEMRLGGREDGKAGFCRLLIEVEFFALSSRKIIVQYIQPITSDKPPPADETAEEAAAAAAAEASMTALSRHGLEPRLVSALLTSDQIDETKSSNSFRFVPIEIAANADDTYVEFRATYEKVREEGAYKLSVVASSSSSSSVQMKVKKYISYPHLNFLSGSGGSGAYVMSWAGYSLRPMFIDWLVFYSLGVFCSILGTLGWSAIRGERRKKTAMTKKTVINDGNVNGKGNGKATDLLSAGEQPQEGLERIATNNEPAAADPAAAVAARSAKSCSTKRRLYNALASFVLALLLGTLVSSSFNAGSLDALLTPHLMHASADQNHADAPFLFAEEEKVDSSKSYNSIPGVTVVKELGATLGFLAYFLGGAPSAAIFGPTVVLCAVRHSLTNPVQQSRPMTLSITTARGDDGKGGKNGDDGDGKTQLLAAMSDGPLAFQTTFLAADGCLLTTTRYRMDLDVQPVQLGGPDRFFLQVEVDVLPEMDTDVVVLYENLDGKEKRVRGTGGGASLVVDDGMTLASTVYDTSQAAAANYVPVVSGGTASWREREEEGRRPVGGMMVVPGQGVGVCGVRRGLRSR